MSMVRFANNTKCLNTEAITSWEDDGTTLTVQLQGSESKTYTAEDRETLLDDRSFYGARRKREP